MESEAATDPPLPLPAPVVRDSGYRLLSGARIVDEGRDSPQRITGIGTVPGRQLSDDIEELGLHRAAPWQVPDWRGPLALHPGLSGSQSELAVTVCQRRHTF